MGEKKTRKDTVQTSAKETVQFGLGRKYKLGRVGNRAGEIIGVRQTVRVSGEAVKLGINSLAITQHWKHTYIHY